MMADNQNPIQDNSDQQTATEVLDWKANLSEEVREHPSLQNIKTPEDLAKSWINAQKFIGREKIPLPPENATEEDWNVVYDALGRPKNFEDYTLPQDIEFPEEIKHTISEEKLTEFKQQAHKLGLLPQQVEGLYRWYMNDLNSQYSNFAKFREQQIQDAEATLRKEWGQSYPEKLALANKVFEAIADEETFKLFDSGLGNDPRIIRAFTKIGEMISEDKLLGKPKHLTKTPQEARQEITRIKSDPKHPLNNEDHPEHQAALEYMNTLYKLAYPEEKAA
jgi:hypothetical protein